MKYLEIIATCIALSAIIWALFSYKKHPKAVGKIGLAVIYTTALSFSLKIFIFSFSKEGGERLVLIFSALIIPALLAAYWHRFWQRHRPDRPRASGQDIGNNSGQ